MCAVLKILTLEERGDQGIESQEERQGKMLLHTEYSLLSLLHTQDGVVHHHGLFQVSGCLSPLPPVPPPWAGYLLGPHLYFEQLTHATPWHPCLLGASGLPGPGRLEAMLGRASCCSAPAVMITAWWEGTQSTSYSLSLKGHFSEKRGKQKVI